MSSFSSLMSTSATVKTFQSTDQPVSYTKNYVCPKCNKYYDFQIAGNNFAGRLPLILNCKHSICQECAHKMYTSKAITCGECNTCSYISDVEVKKKAEQIFPVNFYVFGALSYHKRYGYDNSNVNFKPAGFQFKQPKYGQGHDYKPNSFLSFNASSSPQPAINNSGSLTLEEPEQACSQEGCTRPAKVNCTDCDELFCKQCSDALHNSAKGLKKHKIAPLSSGDCLELKEACSDHDGALIEFICTTCDMYLCCYCVLGEHNGHSFQQMTKMTETDAEEFKNLVEGAEQILKRLQISEKKAKHLANKPLKNNTDTSIELAISKKIEHAIAKLQILERDLLAQAQQYRNQDRISLNGVLETLSVNTRTIANLVNIGKQALDRKTSPKKLNLHLLKKQLESAADTACYFLQNHEKRNSELELVFDESLIEELQQRAKISFSVSNHYSLVTGKQLPADYEEDDDIVVEDTPKSLSTTSSLTELYSTSENQRSRGSHHKVEGWMLPGGSDKGVIHKKTSVNSFKEREVEMPHFKQGDRETVKVTHIASPDSFYVQLLKLSPALNRLSNNIEKHIRSNILLPVQNPQINSLYLVKYISGTVVHWCRARIVEEIFTQDMYLAYFIDYGNSATVKKEDILPIPPDMKKKQPFAIQCKFFDLYPPLGKGDWDPKAVVLMTKIVADNELLMIVTETSSNVLEVDLITTDCDTSVRDALKFLGYGIPYCKSETELDKIRKQLKNIEVVKLYNKPDRYKKEQCIDVVISYVINPHNIYVNLKSCRNDLLRMHEAMDSFYQDNKKGYVYTPKVDMVVAVHYGNSSSNCWRRGVIMESIEGRGVVTVRLVDIGLLISVPWDQIRKLDDRFLAQDCHAKLVKMTHVNPPGGDCEQWPAGIASFFAKYIDGETVLRMVVSETTNPPAVVFFECYTAVHLCLNASLVKEGLAESTGELSATVEWPQHDPLDQEKSAENDSFTISMLKTIQATNHEDRVTAGDADTEEEEVPSNVLKKPVEVISAESPSLIYVIFTESKERLHEFQLELKHHYTKNRLQPSEWEVGYPCVINHRKRYYRGVITEVLAPNEKYRVCLKDYAITVEARAKQLGVLEPQFTKDPEFAIRCHLADITPAGGTGKWSAMACEFLQDLLKKNSKLYLARKGVIDKQRKSMPVVIWSTEFVPGGALESSKTILHSINTLLLKNGLALKEKKVEIEEPRPEEESKKVEEVIEEESPKSPSTETEDHECSSSSSSSSSSTSVAGALKPSKKPAYVDWNDLIEMQKQSPEVIIKDWLAPVRFQKTEFEAIPTFVNYDGEIFLHDAGLDPVLKEMEEKMFEYFQSKTEVEVETTWSPGEMCSVRYFANKKWYRGKVLGVTGDSQVKVTMVDYGNEDDCHPSDLSKEILYFDLPIFANRVVLHDVIPKQNKWLTCDLDVLHVQVVDKRVKVKLTTQEIVGLPTPAVITVDGENINDFMLAFSTNLTRRHPPNANKPESSKLPESDTESDKDVIIEDSDASSSESEDTSPREDVDFDLIKLSYHQEPLPELKPGERLPIVIVNVLTYNRFIFETPQSKVFEEGKLLFEEMTKEINFLVPEQPPLKDFEMGQTCIARYSEDGGWYRAQIIKDVNETEAYVWFVDFGNFECINKKDAREAQKEWLRVPVDHRIATIDGISLASKDRYKEVIKNVMSYCETQHSAEVVVEEPLRLRLFKPGTNRLSYQDLIDAGLLLLEEDEDDVGEASGGGDFMGMLAAGQ